MVSVQGVLTGVNDSEVAEINLESVTFTSYTNRPGFSSSGSGSSPSSLTLATVDRMKRERRQDGSLKSFKKIRMGSSSALWTVMTPMIELRGDVGQPFEASAEASTSGSLVD